MSRLDASPPGPSRIKVRRLYCLVTVSASGGKTLISRLNLLPPPPAADYVLAPMAFVATTQIYQEVLEMYLVFPEIEIAG